MHVPVNTAGSSSKTSWTQVSCWPMHICKCALCWLTACCLLANPCHTAYVGLGHQHSVHPCRELYQRSIFSLLKQGEDLLMEEATSLWANSVQHTGLIVDHLMGKRWVSAAAILRWLFGPKATGMRSADDAMECLKCTDILYNTVARVLARTQVRTLNALCSCS